MSVENEYEASSIVILPLTTFSPASAGIALYSLILGNKYSPRFLNLNPDPSCENLILNLAWVQNLIH